ncbi:MAG: DUF3037 domain-containing protein [Sphingobacteriales bacterium]|nr:DUF3037 domain-containing protein [Sphingobacteriales bacterium]OJW31096.1 MAG: hypothetical protein BGO54_07380 [Sphingobacteriales bacterium 46-32]
MPDQYLYEYAVIRVVPKVEREEFINVGVVMYCQKLRFLDMRFEIDAARLRAFNCRLDPDELQQYLEAFQQICLGRPAGGPIALLDTGARFRWLTATRSTVVQTSRVHPGFCTDASAQLSLLFEQFVSCH